MSDKQIISEKSLNAVQELVLFMKQNVRRREIFQGPNHNVAVQQIVNELERGGQGLRILLEDGLVTESATALENFLAQLRDPLIPHHIQALALDENIGVRTEVIAQDILGLLKQDLSGRHLQLIIAVLDLLHYLLKYSPSNELTGCSIPISMMTVFFDLQTRHMENWRRIASIFVELIRMAPSYLEFSVENESHQNRLPTVENLERDLEFSLFRYFAPTMGLLNETVKLSATSRRHKFRTIFSYVNA